MACHTEAYHDCSGEAVGARLRVNFTLKLLLSQNFCNPPLMRFISFVSNIGPAAAVPAGPAPAPLTEDLDCMLQCPENESATLDNSESHIGLSLCRCHNVLLLHKHRSSESAKATRFRSQRDCRAGD